MDHSVIGAAVGGTVIALYYSLRELSFKQKIMDLTEDVARYKMYYLALQDENRKIKNKQEVLNEL